VSELEERQAITPDEYAHGRFVEKRRVRDLDVTMFMGMYPAIHDRGLEASTWLDAYLRTYVERDARTISNIGNLDAFNRFLGLCAGRSGQLLNRSSRPLL
jgi:predicted AAA+ superfamily ATPase